MLLVGMLDSPYVRRAAITGTLLEVPFEHRSVSVFRHMEEFRAINPLIKAPTLVTDDGIAISESLLIIQHFEDVAGRSLRPLEGVARRRDLALTGIGIVAADKAVSIEYERKRPEAQRYAPWQERIQTQLHTALDLLDYTIALRPHFSEGFHRRAQVHLMRKDEEAALRDLRMTLALEPRHFMALATFAGILRSSGDRKGAYKALLRLKELNPHFPEIGEVLEKLRPEVEGQKI